MPFVRTTLQTGQYAYIDGLPQLKLNPDDFDVATAKVLVRGTRDNVANLFEAGTTNNGLSDNLYCTGSQITREEWGHVWADIEWKGLVGDHDMIFNHTVTTRETMWPQIKDGFTTYFPGNLIGKGTGVHINSATGKPWSVRVIDQLSGVSVRGVSKGSAVAPPQPPRVGGSTPAAGSGTIGDQAISPVAVQTAFSGLIDPIYNWPSGWVLVNYDIQQAIALTGKQALYLWTANYEWKPASSPA